MRATLLALLAAAAASAGCAAQDPPTTTTPDALGAPVEAVNETVDLSGDITAPGAREFPFNVTAGARSVTLTAEFAPEGPAAPIRSVSVKLVDPDGAEAGEESGECTLASGVMTQPSSCELVATAPDAGEWRAMVTGSGDVTVRLLVVVA